jgi:hypothetical protein
VILVNKSFARGEISPYLWARPELEDYPYSARLMENLCVTKEGVAESRPGTKFVDQCRLPDTEKKFLKFIYSTASADTYAIEVGDGYMEWIRAGERVCETAINITSISLGSPCVISFGSNHSWSAGDHVIVKNVGGTVQVDGRYQIETPSASSISLKDMRGNAIDSSAFTAFTSGGTVARVYKIESPYQEEDLPTLKYAQVADVLYLAHPSYAPRKLVRTANTSWTLSTVTFGSDVDGPTALSASAGGAGSLTFKFKVTAIPTSGTESLAGYEAAKAIAGITLTNPPEITTTGNHDYATGDEVKLQNISGTVELNDRRFVITKTGNTTFTLNGVDATGYTAWTSGGSSFRTHTVVSSAAAATSTAPHTVSWTAVSGVSLYAIYCEAYGFYGLVGYSTSTSFPWVGNNPDTEIGPPEYQEEFLFAGDYPGAVASHQQRVVYGGSTNEQDSVKASVAGGFDDFSTHSNPLAEDAVEFTCSANEINQIIHLISLRKLIALTGASEWSIEGDSSGTLLYNAVNARQYTLHGSSHVRPVVVDNDLLYVQARGSIIRSFFFDFSRDSYVSQDVTLKASHFFRGFSIKDMAYAKVPNSILWVVRNDGKLLSLTYNPEVKILAWTGHEMGGGGVVEAVVSIPENDDAEQGGEDAVYLCTSREIGGNTVRYIERLTQREIVQAARDRYTWLGEDDNGYQEEFTSVDSYKTYDGRNTGAGTITASGADYSSGQLVTLTAAGATPFLASDEGTDSTSRKYVLWDEDGEKCVFTVEEYTSSTSVTARPDRDVPDTLQATATTRWAPAIRRMTGLRHIAGEDVSALGDGNEAANALTDSTPVEVSSTGIAVFSDFYTVLSVGLPFYCDLEFHDLEPGDGESWYGRTKTIAGVGVYVKDSHEFYVGTEFPTDGYVGDLAQAEPRNLNDQSADVPPPLRTEFIHVPLKDTAPTEHGRAVIRHLAPRPITIMAATRLLQKVGG